MPLLPVAASRTSAPLATQRLLFQLHADQLTIQRQFDQLSTGRRVLRLSDDPAAASRALGLRRGIDRTEQLSRNADSTASLYRSTDTSLARVDDALVQARGVAVEAAQSVLSAGERETLATTLRQTLQSTFAAGNAMFRDHQLLGGVLDAGDLLQWDGEDILFRGLDAVGRTPLGSGQLAAINITGHDALGVRSAIVEGEPLGAALVDSSRLVDLKAGQGVDAGVLRISDGSQWQTVDFRHAATIGDVAELLESIDVDGRSLTATVTGDALRVEYSDGLPGTLAIADAEGSEMASQLGLSNPLGIQPPPLVATGLAPRVTAATRLADLDSGGGIDVSAGIQIRQGSETFTVDLSAATTLGEVIIAINRSGADVRAELDPALGRIDIRGLRSGVDYSVGENGGNAAEQLGIRSNSAATPLAELGRGRGLELNPGGDDLVITRPDGVQLGLDLDGASTIQDVIDLIRNHPQNQDAQRVTVGLSEFGNGLQLDAPPGADPLTVTETDRSNAGQRLGWIAPGEDTATGVTNGSVVSLIGEDFAPRETGDVYDTLLRLEDAIRAGDFGEIERLQGRLEVDFDRSSRARGRVGIWGQHLEQLQTVAEDDLLALRRQLADEVDADFATVLSDLTQRQTALEASLRLIGETARLTVLNYL